MASLRNNAGLEPADLAEAALRLNTDPDSLARILASRADRDTDETFRTIEERLYLAAKEIAENRHALKALHHSWSWRLTAPLRALVEWCRILSLTLRHGARGFWQRRRWFGFMQWLRYGLAIRSSHLFDEPYYLAQNPDVAWLGINPLLHYFVFGSAENRKPNCLFDGDFYRKYNPDVALSMMNPLLHYWKWGALEGRNPHPEFDSRYYLAQCPQLHQENWNPLAHFLGPGVVEGRNPTPWFNTIAYLERNPAAAALGVNPVVHYVEHNSRCSRW